MAIPTFFASMSLAGMMCLGTTPVSGQNYPDKPIRIFTSQPGGGSDSIGRLIGPGITAVLNQPVIVDNRVDVIAAENAAKAPPDGYTLLLNGSIIWISTLLTDNPTYDTVRDFSPITLVGSTPNILVIYPSLAVNSVKELIAVAKAKPGELNYSSATAGASTHLAAELFKSMAGLNIVRVNYKGAGPALNAILGGETQVSFPSAASAVPHLKSGKLRALAVTSLQPSGLTPGLATLASSGLPGYESLQIYGVLAPAKTPAAIIDRLYQEILRVVNRPESKERLFNSGLEVVTSSPQAYAATIKSDIAKWAKLIKDVGIHGE